MIDFVLAAALTITSVAVVRRLRTQGFEGLRPPATLFGPIRAEPATDGAPPAELQAGTSEPGLPPIRSRVVSALRLTGPISPVELPPPAASRRPSTFLAAWLAGIVLLVIAILLQRELWFMRGDMTPLWALLAVGGVFAVVCWLGLQMPEAVHPAPIAPGASHVDATGEPMRVTGSTGSDPSSGADPSLADAQEAPGGVKGRAFAVPGWQLIAAAFAMELFALVIWAGTTSSNLAWVLHLAAGPAFLLGVWRATRTRLAPLLGTWSSIDTLVVAVLCVLSLIPRVWQLSTVPEGIWFDEGLRGIEALRIAADANYRPVFVSQILQEPTAFWYLMIPFLQTMGRDPAALRLPSAIAGALGVGAVYLLARVLFERRTALIAAGLTVGMTWHINYSRVAFLAMWSVMLDALAAALFVLALRRRSVFLYAAAGLTAGIAIHFYYSSRLLPPILAVVVVYRLIAERGRFIKLHGLGLVVCALGFLLAAAPIGEYALLHPQEFSARTETVSVFKEVEQAKSWDPLINSAKAHLLMFNFHGDNNGRHNWTGRPMLDSVTGALFILGLAIAVTRLRHWSYAMVLAWVPIMLLGGTLSLSWEAPQSHRAVEEVTAVAILAALPLALLWRAADALPIAFSALTARTRRLAVATSPSGEAALPFGGAGPMAIWSPGGGAAVAEPAGAAAPINPSEPGSAPAPGFPTFVARWFGVLVIGLVVVAGILNIQRYFGPQQHDNRTWQEFSTPQTIAGRMINNAPVDWKIYVDPTFLGNPSMHFMIRGDRQLVPYDPAAMPIVEPAAMVFLSNREQASAARVAQFYPAAQRQLVKQPEGDEVGLYAFTLSPEDVQESQGVVATYRVGDSPTKRREGRLEFDWTMNPPVPQPFAATLETTLTAPAYGTYRFRLEAPGNAMLIVDGVPITTGGGDGEMVLARGVHALRLEVPEAGGAAVRLFWAPQNREFESIPATLLHVPPVRATGLLASLYRGAEPSGEPASAKVDPAVELKVHSLPLPRPYTIEWQGAVRAHRDGVYRFGTTSIDASAVWVDGQQLVDNRRGNTYVDGAINLTAGWHDIRVRFLDATSFTHVTLYWEPPEGGRAVVPTDALRPWPADRVMLAQPEDMDLNRREAPALAGGARRPAMSGVRMLASPSELVQPRGVALAPDGTVYIADAGRPGVFVVPPDGEPRQLAEGAFREPVAVAILADRTIAVLDAGAASVWRMQPDGTGVERILSEVPLYGPRGIAAAADGTIAIADTGNNRVVLAQPNGSVSTVGNLKEPTDVAFLPDGNLLVADTGSRNLRVVKRTGEGVSSWSMPNAFTVVGPHVATLPGGGWVATSPEARSLLRFPPNGRSPDTWDLGIAWQKPVGIAAGRAGVVIADTDAAAVVMVGLP